ncbi:MAG: 3-deoxy-manno-octulosonate cytidylyltransferase [Proteobacteria bacterium]|jgi:3-deoxy-manno-octulosonate cytidylyltransferase (CMP-KDO synthetase)|nr:manno-octulosonate cytidylyltransferase [Alphaproteobacteria bacterium]NCC04115.1 3-deoxy-manno-octulosonate cytidylyltransferase [Pseudomonadota bacterium]
MKTLIVIPARYGSTRLPGKPLLKIAGQTLLGRVVAIAKHVARHVPNTEILIATDDQRILDHAKELDTPCVLTPESCPTGTDRVLAAMKQAQAAPDFIINLQGDAPLTPPDFVQELINGFEKAPCDIITPVVRLTWVELDALRESKKTTPFSGTTAVFNEETGQAFWFSKTILPAIRKEEKLQQTNAFAPVWRHIGLYGYSRAMLEAFVTLPKGFYEEQEGLEQLRALEHGYKIRCVSVNYKGRANTTGVDSPEDIARVEALIAKHGEML